MMAFSIAITAHDMAPFARDMGYQGEPFRHDEAAHGRFLTRDLILAQMDALSAGDCDAVVALR